MSLVKDPSEFVGIMYTDNLSDTDYKKYRYNEIDAKTGQLIRQGFMYGDKLFSFSENAQRNILGIYTAKDVLQYPIDWNTKDDTETIQLADATAVTNFFLTALGTKKAHQDSGTSLKNQIRGAANRAAMEAILDNR